MKTIRTAALILAVSAALTLTACKPGNTENSGSEENSSNVSDSSNSSETFLDRASKFIEADGRSYGKEFTAGIGERLDNKFFSLKVTEAYRYSSMADYLPDEGKDFVVVNITVGNIFSESIPVGTYDYVLRWGEGDENSDTAYEVGNLHTDYDLKFFPDDTTLAKSASKSGYLLFQAPSDSTDLQLEYVEIYEDDFDGNTYRINLGNPEFAANDYKPTPAELGIETGEYDYNDYSVMGEMGKPLPTGYFDFCVNSVGAGELIGDYVADEGCVFVTADITVTGTQPEETDVGANIFYILYTEADGIDEYDYPLDATVLGCDGLFPLEGEMLAQGETVSGTVIFEAPVDSTNVSIAVIGLNDNEIITYYEVPIGEPANMAPITLAVNA